MQPNLKLAMKHLETPLLTPWPFNSKMIYLPSPKPDSKPLKCKLKWIKLLLTPMPRELTNKNNTMLLSKMTTQAPNCKVL